MVLKHRKDPYAVLAAIPGTGPFTAASTPAELRSAYLRLAVAVHPDKHKQAPEATEAFQVLIRAYEAAASAKPVAAKKPGKPTPKKKAAPKKAKKKKGSDSDDDDDSESEEELPDSKRTAVAKKPSTTSHQRGVSGVTPICIDFLDLSFFFSI